jgi:hypothetical protein
MCQPSKREQAQDKALLANVFERCVKKHGE